MFPTSHRFSLLVLSLLVLPLLLSACGTTKLTVAKLDHGVISTTPSGDTTPMPDGLVYFLPTLEVGLEYKRRITACSLPSPIPWLDGEVRNLDSIRRALVNVTGVRSTVDQLKNRFGDAYKFVDSHAHDLMASTEPFTGDQAKTAMNLLMDAALLDASKGFQDDFPKGFVDIVKDRQESPRDRLIKLGRLLKDVPSSSTTKLSFGVASTVTAEARYLPDHDHGYVMRYSGLRKGNKQTSIDIEKFSNGALKSINAGFEDRSSEIIASTLTGVLRLAGAASGFPTAAVTAAGAPPPSQGDKLKAPAPLLALCKASIYKALKERKKLANAINPKQKTILGLETQLRKQATLLAGKQGKLAAARAKFADLVAKGVTPAIKLWHTAKQAVDKLVAEAGEVDTEISNLNGKKRKLESEIGKAKKRLESLDKSLTHTEIETFRPTSTEIQASVPGAKAAMKKWFNLEASKRLCQPTELCDDDVPKKLLAWSAIYRPSGVSSSPANQTLKTHGNLVYREPAIGSLMVCKEEPCLDNGNISGQKADRLMDKKINVPQLGVLATLSLVNKNFQNNNLVATFSESGALLKMKYTSNARLEAMAKSFEGSTGSLSAFIDSRRQADQAALDRETAKINADRDRILAKLEREKAQRCLEGFRNDLTLDGC